MSRTERAAGRLRGRTEVLTIRATFFVHALIAGSMTTRIADFQTGLHLDAAGLGLALLGQPVGALAMIFVASRAVDALGTRLVLAAGLPLLALAALGLALAPSVAAIFAVFVLYGAAFSLTNVAINVEADRIEAASGLRVMNSCHGGWSVGFLVASLFGAFARGEAISAAWHLLVLQPIVFAFALAVLLPMAEAPPRPHAGNRGPRAIATPTRMTWLLLGFITAGSLLDGAGRTWSVIFMRDSFAAPAWLDTLTLPAYFVTTSTGRLLADSAVARFGPVRVAHGLGLLALAGLLLVAAAQGVVPALLGFALIGAGICVGIPLSMSAAARAGDRPASENVAALSLLNQVVSPAAPALIGGLAAALGLRAVYLLLVLPLLGSLVLARHLAPPDRR
jgi:MFS family permease